MLQGYSTREVRVASTPTISVLLTSTGQRDRLEACLRQISPVCQQLEAELIVARAYNDEELGEMRVAFPDVYFAAAPAGSTLAELRTVGMAGADGDIVVLSDAATITTDELIDRFVQSRRKEQD